MSTTLSTSTSLLAGVSDELANAVERAGAGVVTVDARRRIPGSGIVWSNDGLIVTANHVVEREEEIEVGLPDGRKVERIIARARSRKRPGPAAGGGRRPRPTRTVICRAESGASRPGHWPSGSEWSRWRPLALLAPLADRCECAEGPLWSAMFAPTWRCCQDFPAVHWSTQRATLSVSTPPPWVAPAS